MNLPQGKAKDLASETARTISIDGDGVVYLDEEQITLPGLSVSMKTLGEGDPRTVVMVRADRGIEYGKVVEVMKILHDCGITKMALVTQADGK